MPLVKLQSSVLKSYGIKVEHDLNRHISSIVLDVARTFSMNVMRDEVTITLKDARK